MTERWYVAQTAPQRERFAVENLIADGWGADLIWLPEHNARLFMPGYLFVATAGQPTGVRYCEGVLRLLPHSETPLPVPSDQMAVMREVCRAAAEAIERNRGPEVGDRVEVTDGPLRNWRGVVELTQKRMLKVLLPLFGSVTLPADQVVKISPDQADDPWEHASHRRGKRGLRGRGAAPFPVSTRA
jgi:transcription antitermination factor NusG